MDKSIARTKEFFDGLAASWDETSRPRYEALDAVLSVCGFKAGCRVLDVACGTGVMIPALRKANAAYIRAIDVSEKMAAIAAEKFAGCAEVSISAEDFYVFAEIGFDIITVYNAYPHFFDKERFAQAARRCLLPDGRLIIAHGDGRGVINGRHAECRNFALSTELLSPSAEAERLPGFVFDTQIDRTELYVLSGLAV